jgi:AraC family transcriptional regulator, arabinose operon regulatory protein
MDHPTLFTARSFEVRLNSRPTYWHCEPGWEWKSHPLPDHLLWYVMDGRGETKLEQRRWQLQAGSCFVFGPGDQPHCTQDPDHRLVVFGMHFDMLDSGGQPLHLTEGLRPPPGLIVRDTAFFATLAQRCDGAYRHGDGIGAAQSRLFLQAMLLQLWEEALRPAPSAVDLALDEVVRAIQREPGRRWSVDELAERAHLSRSQFVRRFRALVGRSPAHFMIQARVERARQLIQETDMPLGQIASALGYEDVYFFSRQYKQYTGTAPSALRRSPQRVDR